MVVELLFFCCPLVVVVVVVKDEKMTIVSIIRPRPNTFTFLPTCAPSRCIPVFVLLLLATVSTGDDVDDDDDGEPPSFRFPLTKDGDGDGGSIDVVVTIFTVGQLDKKVNEISREFQSHIRFPE